MLSWCWEGTKGVCIRYSAKAAHKLSNHRPKVISIHIVLRGLIHKAMQNPEQEVYKDWTFLPGFQVYSWIWEKPEKPQLCSELGCGLRLAADPPPRLEAVEFFSRCGRLIFLMTHCCNTENNRNGDRKSNTNRLHEKQLICVLLLLGTI